MASSQAKKGSSGTKKRTSSKTGTSQNKKENIKKTTPYVPSEKEKEILNEAKLLSAIALCLFLTLSNFHVFGRLGNAVSDIMFGCFGLLSYILPILVFFGVAFLISNISNRKAVIKFVAASVMAILLCALLQLLLVQYHSSSTISELYNYCKTNRTGGGVLGGLITKGLCSMVGIFGAYLLVLFLLLIDIVIITEHSVIHQVKASGNKMYQSAKEGSERRQREREHQRREREHQQLNRIHNKAKGIASDTTVGEEDAPEEEIFSKKVEIQEITDRFPNSQIYQGHIEIEDYVEEITEPEIQSKPKERYTPVWEDVKEEKEEVHEPFVPKEKIEVSKQALETMNRKAFATSTAASLEKPKASIPSSGQAVSMSPAKTPRRRASKSEDFILPPVTLLNKAAGRKATGAKAELSKTADLLQQTLDNFGVRVTITNYCKGPSVTRYELQPEMGTKVSKITSLADDIKLNLAAADIRIEAPIPGKAAVGIEVPNQTRESVLLRDLIESKELKEHPSKIAFAAGKDIAGNVIVADIAKMPHMLIAGTTGSGKSVFTNSIIMSILFRAKPSEVKMIIVDPKVVEFGVYNGIPHLMIPVVTDPKKAAGALNWAVSEMAERYKKFASLNVRDLKGYNEAIKKQKTETGEEQAMPQIVIIIDELADLMMVAAKEVEESICRLAQLARAAGIHLIIATQRPSVDVVTGLIKANIPSRVALLVSSGTDSRTIIDMNGAEKLLGNGDMLFYPSGYVKPVRLQGAFVSDAEVQKVVGFLQDQAEEEPYNEEVSKKVMEADIGQGMSGAGEDGRDEYFVEAAKFVVEKEKGSTSMLQRMFKIGFNRAGRIMDQLAEAGIVGPEEGTKPRKVLMSMEELEMFLQQ